MREVFVDLSAHTVDIDYTVGGGTKPKASRELIITNEASASSRAAAA